MLTIEAYLYWMRLLIAQPLVLSCYTNKVPEHPKLDDFVESGAAPQLELASSDWTLDEKTATARCQKTFTFSQKGERIFGWYMATKDGIVIDWNEFEHPVPILSTRDKIHVAPCICLERETIEA